MLTALYDGNCVICRSTCETMRALDWLQRIEFINLHEDADWQDRYPEARIRAADGRDSRD